MQLPVALTDRLFVGPLHTSLQPLVKPHRLPAQGRPLPLKGGVSETVTPPVNPLLSAAPQIQRGNARARGAVRGGSRSLPCVVVLRCSHASGCRQKKGGTCPACCCSLQRDRRVRLAYLAQRHLGRCHHGKRRLAVPTASTRTATSPPVAGSMFVVASPILRGGCTLTSASLPAFVKRAIVPPGCAVVN